MQPVRSAIDHVLNLVGDSPLADVLVLRGSVTLLAWAGAAAREPGDIDFVVRPPSIVPQDRWWPYPFVDNVHRVRTDPETVHRTARDELWAAEDFAAEGRRAVVPPDGLHWMRSDDLADEERPHHTLFELIHDHPATPELVLLDTMDATVGASYGYDYGEGQAGGARLVIPLAGDHASLQIDLAYDEVLPEPPVLTAIPRADGSRNALWTASPRLSLEWKLQYLAAEGLAKDLYDAVLLAEYLHVPMDFDLSTVPPIQEHLALLDNPGHWLDRLARAIAR